MKVLFFIRDLAVGGSQRQLAVLAAALARRGHDVAVIVLYADGALEALLGGSGARVLSIGKSSRWHAFAPLARLRRLFLSERADLVYAFLPTQTTLAALLLPPRLKTKLVFGLRAGGVQLDQYDTLNALTTGWKHGFLGAPISPSPMRGPCAPTRSGVGCRPTVSRSS